MARHLNYYDCGWVSFVQIVIFLAPGSTFYRIRWGAGATDIHISLPLIQFNHSYHFTST